MERGHQSCIAKSGYTNSLREGLGCWQVISAFKSHPLNRKTLNCHQHSPSKSHTTKSEAKGDSGLGVSQKPAFSKQTTEAKEGLKHILCYSKRGACACSARPVTRCRMWTLCGLGMKNHIKEEVALSSSAIKHHIKGKNTAMYWTFPALTHPGLTVLYI